MNWILMAVGAVFLICIIVGICKGAIKIAVSLAATFLTLVIVFFATPFVAQLIGKLTPAEEIIQKQVVATMAGMASTQIEGVEEEVEEGITAEKVKKVLSAAGISEETLQQYGVSIDDIVNGNVSTEELSKYGISSGLLAGISGSSSGKTNIEDAVENAEIPRDIQIAAIEKADLPTVFKTLLTTNNNKDMYKELGVKTFAQYVGHYLAKLVINIIAFLSTFIIVTIIIRAIVFALDFVSELPVLGILNRLAGGVIGGVGALIIVWTFFIVVTLLYVTEFGKQMYQMIDSNTFLQLLYDYNPILKLSTMFR